VPAEQDDETDDERAGVRVSGISAAVSRVRGTADVVYREMLKFGAVGTFAFVVDVGLFNVLTSDLWFGSGSPPLDGHEKIAKVVSASAATIVAWLGNRYWSFRHRRQSSLAREFLAFVVMNAIAMLIAVACLAVSHDLLGFTSNLADNISGNVIGIGLGTLFRFWAYRTFVFTEFIDPEGRDRAEDPEAEQLEPEPLEPEPLEPVSLEPVPLESAPLEPAPLEPGTPDRARPVALEMRRLVVDAEPASPNGHGMVTAAEPESPRRAAG
jgi:putative flippase GtrA